MLKKILLGLLTLLAAFLLYVSTKPDTFRVQRSLTMASPPEQIFPHLQDFHAWSGWSPYENLDPAMKRSFSGATAGPGAVYAWDGDKSGAGRMEILETQAPTRVLIKLDFTKPMEGHNTTEFTLVPTAAGTQVTWTMQGPQRFISKLAGTFFDLDALLGKDFETGLTNLQAQAQK